MKTKEEILQKATLLCKGTRLNRDGSEYKIMINAMQEYSDLTNAKLVEENEIEKKRADKLEDFNNHLESTIKELKQTIDRMANRMQEIDKQHQSELSAAKERVKELEKNVRQLCTLLAKDQILLFLSQGEKDRIMDILKTLTPKQHG